MYDVWTSWLSEELLSQAVRVDGILYLPVYDLVGEMTRMALPVMACGMVLAALVALGVSGCFFCTLMASKVQPQNA